MKRKAIIAATMVAGLTAAGATVGVTQSQAATNAGTTKSIRGLRVQIRNMGNDPRVACAYPKSGPRTPIPGGIVYHGTRKVNPDVNAIQVGKTPSPAISGLKADSFYYEGYSSYRLYSGCRDKAGKDRFYVAVTYDVVKKTDTVAYYSGGGGLTPGPSRSTGWRSGVFCKQVIEATFDKPGRGQCLMSTIPGAD